MRVLVTVGSKHGATVEIARQVRDALANRGVDAELESPDAVRSLDGFDAVVLGSAIYAGQWRPDAKAFVARFGDQLSAMPVWAFSSGPLGDPPVPQGDPEGAAEIIDATGARGHRVFAGKLDRSKLNLVERSMVKAVKAPYGDYRDWDAIRSWADGIGEALAYLERDLVNS